MSECEIGWRSRKGAGAESEIVFHSGHSTT
jgi:hypothetical protein